MPSSSSSSFALDHVLTPKLDTNPCTTHSHIFQPFRTPSASTLLNQSTTSFTSHDGLPTCRKRSRRDSHLSDDVPPTFDDRSWSAAQSQSALDTPGVMSPVPFVSTRYRLAGVLDTPSAEYASVTERATSPDLTLRAGRGWHPGGGGGAGGGAGSPGSYFPLLAREGNGRSRAGKKVASRQEGWGKTIYSVIGVAGRVWDFCRVNAFRGFYAGGGQGYAMRPSGEMMNGERSVWESCDEKGRLGAGGDGQVVVPGGFPEEDYIPDYISNEHMTPCRPAKRIQREKGETGLGASWVMVERSHARISRDSSPSRISTRKVPVKSSSPGRRPASRAGQRPTQHAPRPSLTSSAGSLALSPGRPASFANTRSPVSSPRHESPVSVDVQRHMARIRKRELEEDANLKRLNQQLKAMIREGKEALGTKFEVEEVLEDVVDEGYVEGDYVDRSMA